MNFDEWWNEDYDDKDNPFEKDSFGYWAYAGWCAAMQALRQEFVQSEREWVGLTDEDISKAKTLLKDNDPEYAIFFIMNRLQEYNTCR